MKVSEQGARRDRHHVLPRVLIFLSGRHPETGENEVLLLKGAPTKRLWANRYNGLGGHVEANEDVLAAAQRELAEEAGIVAVPLTLTGVIHIDAGNDAAGALPGILVFVFCGESNQRTTISSAEGTPEWVPLSRLAAYPLVDDLHQVIPLALSGEFFYGHYRPNSQGEMVYEFRKTPAILAT